MKTQSLMNYNDNIFREKLGFLEADSIIKVRNCKSWQELIDFLINRKNIVFYSNSHCRYNQRVYNPQQVIDSIQLVFHKKYALNRVTYAYGIREKVAELILEKNYGQPIPEELLK